MTTDRVRTLEGAEERETLRVPIGSFFGGWDPDRSGIFLPQLSGFLFFDQHHATEPHLFRQFLQRCGTALHIGYLPPFFAEAEQDSRVPALRVEPDAGPEELQRAFTRDPGFTDDAAIQYFVRSGFILGPEPRWAVWFSTYWEIAICGFREAADADDFLRRHGDLTFLTSAEVVEIYSSNPASAAPRTLAPYLRKNLLDRRSREPGSSASR